MYERVEVLLPCDRSAGRIARAALAAFGVNPQGDVVISELVTNAVEHGAPPISVFALRTPEFVHVSVRDARPDIGHAAPDAVGLRLVEAFSARWGVTPAHNGKAVWAEFAS